MDYPRYRFMGGRVSCEHGALVEFGQTLAIPAEAADKLLRAQVAIVPEAIFGNFFSTAEVSRCAQDLSAGDDAFQARYHACLGLVKDLRAAATRRYQDLKESVASKKGFGTASKAVNQRARVDEVNAGVTKALGAVRHPDLPKLAPPRASALTRQGEE